MTDETPIEEKREHPLLAAFHDMKRVAVTNKGLKALARIQHGIENRERWIENRQAQIEELKGLSQEVLNAYDDGDGPMMAGLLLEIERIVAMSEGMSETEMQVAEVLDEDNDTPFPPKSRLPFKTRRAP